jgi:guanylate kinase
LDIDVQGVRQVKKSKLLCKYIFIFPPSIELLESRLRGRGTETEDKIAVRLRNAIDEIEFGNGEGNFDAKIINNNLETAFNELESNLKSWYPELNVVEKTNVLQS